MPSYEPFSSFVATDAQSASFENIQTKGPKNARLPLRGGNGEQIARQALTLTREASGELGAGALPHPVDSPNSGGGVALQPKVNTASSISSREASARTNQSANSVNTSGLINRRRYL